MEGKIGAGWSLIGVLEAGFDPYSGMLINGPRSRADNNVNAVGTRTANFNSSRAGQWDNSQGFVGLSNADYGALKVRRQPGRCLVPGRLEPRCARRRLCRRDGLERLWRLGERLSPCAELRPRRWDPNPLLTVLQPQQVPENDLEPWSPGALEPAVPASGPKSATASFLSTRSLINQKSDYNGLHQDRRRGSRSPARVLDIAEKRKRRLSDWKRLVASKTARP